jgi:hypothetical protein
MSKFKDYLEQTSSIKQVIQESVDIKKKFNLEDMYLQMYYQSQLSKICKENHVEPYIELDSSDNAGVYVNIAKYIEWVLPITPEEFLNGYMDYRKKIEDVETKFESKKFIIAKYLQTNEDKPKDIVAYINSGIWKKRRLDKIKELEN